MIQIFRFFELSNNYTFKPVQTWYEEIFFPVSALPTIPQDRDIHLVAFEPIIDPNTFEHVHHFIIADVVPPLKQTTLFGWAPGVGSTVLPREAGFLVSPTTANAIKTIMFQTHYDNPGLLSGMVDHSSVRIYYTAKLRQHRATVILMGDAAVTQPLPIAKGNGLSKWEYDCPSACTETWPTLHVFAVALHMHVTGKQIWGTQWRNNALVRETNRIDFFDFGFQQATPETFDILPGDRINTHCIYQRQVDHDVRFFFGSEDEMCIQFVSVYPFIDSPACGYVSPLPNTTADTFCNNAFVEGLPHNPTVPDPVTPRVTFGDATATTCNPTDGMNAADRATVSFMSMFAVIALMARFAM